MELVRAAEFVQQADAVERRVVAAPEPIGLEAGPMILLLVQVERDRKRGLGHVAAGLVPAS